METLPSKRKLNDTEREVGSSQNSVGKILVSSSQLVCSSPGNITRTATESTKPAIINRTFGIPALKLVTFVPMNPSVTANKALVTSSPTSSCPDGSSTRKFRYTSLNNLKRPPIRPEISVTSNVATQTNPSYLRDNSPASKQQAIASKTDLYAVCGWCGYLSKNFSNCDRCKHSLNQDLKNFTRQTANVPKPSQQTTASPTTIATIIPQAIVLTPQNNTTSLLASPAMIKSGQFYGHQLSVQPVSTTTPTRILPQVTNGASKILVVGKQPTPVRSYRGKKKAEPECLTISSDEDESQVPSKASVPGEPDHLSSSTAAKDGQSSLDENGDGSTASQTANKEMGSAGGPTSSLSWPNSSPPDSSDQTEEESICIKCRSIRVGSYKVQAFDPQALFVTVTPKEIKFTVTCIEGLRVVDISIQKEDIPSVLAHFGKVLPVLFIYTTPACAGTIRSKLNMTSREKPYYDPCSSEESMKRITILPVCLNEQQKLFLTKMFRGSSLQEIKQALANEVLIKSTPGPQFVGISRAETRTQIQVAQVSQILQQPKVTKEVVKLVTYPPPPQTGGIEINSEDLECLNEGEFLNDVIIDFYLKYLVNERLSPSDRQQTHIFSSFFFPRLTTKHTDEEINTNLIRRRHARVKTWTRHVDIFEKDFIVVPINQNSHWFLAVICFPGMTPQDIGKQGGEKYEESKVQESPDGEECEPPISQDSPTGSLTLDQMDTDDQESPLPPACPMTVPLPGLEDTPPSQGNPPLVDNVPDSSKDRGPCILIFDSLPGNHRWKVVQTLREYLTIEYEIKKKVTRVFDRNTMRGMNVTLLPRQENYTDCGIFLLQYVESFFETPLKKFSTPLPSLVNWFPESKIAGKRQELKELILSLQKQQQENSSNKGSQEKSV